MFWAINNIICDDIMSSDSRLFHWYRRELLFWMCVQFRNFQLQIWRFRQPEFTLHSMCRILSCITSPAGNACFTPKYLIDVRCIVSLFSSPPSRERSISSFDQPLLPITQFSNSHMGSYRADNRQSRRGRVGSVFWCCLRRNGCQVKEVDRLTQLHRRVLNFFSQPSEPNCANG